MNELLYIDGQLVDLSEGVNITLSYKSNMLTDLSKIVGNNSYTIKLPKTMRNLSIIGMSDVPSVVSSFPREYHECRYFRNGVEVIPNGKAVLMGVGDSIEIVITWGGASAFSKIVEEGKKLTDFTEETTWIAWTDVVSPSSYGTANIMYADMDMGLKTSETKAKLHPSVRVSYILSLIQSVYGVRFAFPSDRQKFISNLIIPLLTRNGGYANRFSNTGYIRKNDDGGLYLSKNSMFDSYFGHTESNFVFQAKTSGRLVIKPSFSSLYMGANVGYGSTVNDNTVYLPYSVDAYVSVYNYTEAVEIDLAEGDYFVVNTGLFPATIGNSQEVYSFGMQPDEIQLGDRFPIIENLPDIKVIDFIKAIASMCGVFAIPSTNSNEVKFVPFDDLSDKSKALDWSDFVLVSDSYNRPRNIDYTLDDFARNNRMKYKEDDTVGMNANSNISVGDNTLEYERDAVQLPFAASDMQGSRAKLALYKYNEDNEPELQDLQSRILTETNVNGYSTGSFDGLHWSTLIANYYQTYQNAVKSPVIITENIRLNEISLRDLDVAKPVYLRQYGKYYAIVEVKASRNGVCECKLLQLD